MSAHENWDDTCFFMPVFSQTNFTESSLGKAWNDISSQKNIPPTWTAFAWEVKRYWQRTTSLMRLRHLVLWFRLTTDSIDRFASLWVNRKNIASIPDTCLKRFLVVTDIGFLNVLLCHGGDQSWDLKTARQELDQRTTSPTQEPFYPI